MTDPQSLAIATELETQRAWALTRAAQAAGQIGALQARIENLEAELAKRDAADKAREEAQQAADDALGRHAASREDGA